MDPLIPAALGIVLSAAVVAYVLQPLFRRQSRNSGDTKKIG